MFVRGCWQPAGTVCPRGPGREWRRAPTEIGALRGQGQRGTRELGAEGGLCPSRPSLENKMFICSPSTHYQINYRFYRQFVFTITRLCPVAVVTLSPLEYFGTVYQVLLRLVLLYSMGPRCNRRSRLYLFFVRLAVSRITPELMRFSHSLRFNEGAAHSANSAHDVGKHLLASLSLAACRWF